MLGIPYESKEAELFNKKVFACIYFNSLAKSVELAIKNDPYETFEGSQLSLGKFQFDLWKEEYEVVEKWTNEVRHEEDDLPVDPSEWGQQPIDLSVGDHVINKEITVAPSWDSLRQHILSYGVRNCQRTAIMPSASTSRLMSNTECIEAHQECIYIRNFMKHSMVVINKHLQYALEKHGWWSSDVAEFIVAEHGSAQRLPEFLQNDSAELNRICSLFKTMFEIKQKISFTHTAQRHRYIDQGISANVYFAKPTIAMMKNFHLFTWKLGINTGMYYLRSAPGGDATNFSIASQKVRDFFKGVPSSSSSSVPVKRNPPPREEVVVVTTNVTTTVDEAFCKFGCTSCGS
jgi:ribonucleoside-diphosphate reductase alpha chain